MAEATNYVTATGFVQFDPIERDANGKSVTDVTIKLPGGDKTYIKITIWPELNLSAPIQKGDFIAVDGPFSSSSYQDKEGNQRTGLQISAYNLNVNGVRIERKDREVVDAKPQPSNNVPF